jgi:photosystem II stability/assembly factor-like uncharacterized protein
MIRMFHTCAGFITTILVFWGTVGFSFAGWEAQDAGTAVNLHDITASHSSIEFAWACGDSGTILYTSDGGDTWTRQETGTQQALRSIAFYELEAGPVVAVGDSGLILMRTQNDSTWRRIESPTTESLRSVSDFGAMIVGDHGTILQSTNNGLSWTVTESPTTVRLNGGSVGFPPSLIAGDSGVVLRERLPEGNFVACSTGTTANMYGIPMFSSSNLVVGDSGLILRSSDFGAHWHRQNAPATTTLRAVEFSVNNTSHVYVVGDSGTILKTTDEGANWVRQTSGTSHNLSGLFFYLDDNNGFACGDSGTILRTRDGGESGSVAPEAVAVRPRAFALHSSYPNPFNPTTTISFSLKEAGFVKLAVYDVNGRLVRELVNGRGEAGEQRVVFDGRNLATGVYLVRMECGEFRDTQKVVLLK